MDNNVKIKSISFGMLIISGLIITIIMIIDLIANGKILLESLIIYGCAYGILLAAFSMIKEKSKK